MKFIHTSDWHLGRSFGPHDLQGDQERFTDWLVELAVAEKVDMVVIAGDIYDWYTPPVSAIALFRQTVARLVDRGIVVAAITGNHDAADRVVPYGNMLDQTGFYVRGGYVDVGGVITHTFADGDLDIVLLPFLEPRMASDDFLATNSANDDPGDTQQEQVAPAVPNASASTAADTSAALQGAESAEDDDSIDAHQLRRRSRTHQSVLEIATQRVRRVSQRSVAVSHAFVTGGTSSDSERQFTVGGTGEVQAGIYAGFSYVALGHLHRPQDITRPGTDASESMRYCGTPLAYSFSEEHEKSVTVVEMDALGKCRRSIVPVPVGRSVRTLTGTIIDLLENPRFDDAHDAFVRAVLTDNETVLDAGARLRSRFPYVVEIALQPENRLAIAGEAPDNVAQQTPIVVARAFWEEAEGAPPDADIDALLVDAIEHADAHAPAGASR